MSITATQPHHRVRSEDVPALEETPRVLVSLTEVPGGIGVGHILQYEPFPPRLRTTRSNHPTADLVPCGHNEVHIIPMITLTADPADCWLVVRAGRYQLTLTPFGKV